MGLKDRLKNKINDRKLFVAQRREAKRVIKKKSNAEYFRALEKEEKAQARLRAKRKAQPVSFNLKKGLTTVRTAVRKAGQKQASNPALALPKKEVYTPTKSADQLLGFGKKEKEALPKKKVTLKKRVVYEYE